MTECYMQFLYHCYTSWSKEFPEYVELTAKQSVDITIDMRCLMTGIIK